jgi:guanylate kinase
MKKGKIIIISGPSGSGKTTLYNHLLEEPWQGKLVKSISVTTRSKRSHEIHGKDYIFVTPKMFQHKIRAGHFLESEKVFDNHYGTPQKNVLGLLKEGRCVLLCIDVKGAKVVVKKFPEAVRIFIKTASLDDLKRRLEKRASESTADMHTRLTRARNELKEAKNYDHVVVNDNLKTAYKKLRAIVSAYINK